MTWEGALENWDNPHLRSRVRMKKKKRLALHWQAYVYITQLLSVKAHQLGFPSPVSLILTPSLPTVCNPAGMGEDETAY